jgi:putative endonuclease
MADYYVYILECCDGSYYTGYTTDLQRRYRQHQSGQARCRYTRSFPPKRIAAYWLFDTKSDALVVEHQIKKMSKQEKKVHIESWQQSVDQRQNTRA